MSNQAQTPRTPVGYTAAQLRKLADFMDTLAVIEPMEWAKDASFGVHTTEVVVYSANKSSAAHINLNGSEPLAYFKLGMWRPRNG